MTNMESPSFGTWLRLKRKSLDLSREAFASQLGYSAAMIRKIETEERRPSTELIQRLAEVFAIPIVEREAFQRFAQGEIRSAPISMKKMTVWSAPASIPRQRIPSPTTSLIGRKKEVHDLANYLIDPVIRLVTILGPPGIGKTRLAIETASSLLHSFSDGVYFVALAPLENPDTIASTIAQAIGYVESKGPTTPEQLAKGINEKSMLLVMDNCEHLVEAVAPLAYELLTACPRLNILSTSREALKVPGEWLFYASTLPYPPEGTQTGTDDYPALTLFAERASAIRPGFSLVESNLPDIAAICRKLDGLPLAIELIAAHIRSMSPRALLDQLTDQKILTADGRRAVPERQKTLNNAIGWSYHALAPLEQSLFEGLSVFNGGWYLEAVDTLFSDRFPGASISDLVTSLADKSLLQRNFDERGDVRFSMLATIRLYAASKLFERGDQTTVHNHHLAYFMEFAERGDQHIHGPDQTEWIDRLERENDNFRAALEWGISTQKTEVVLRLLIALGWSWEVRGHYGEAHCWLDEIRALPDIPAYPVLFARLLNHIGRHSWTQESIQEAYTLLEESQSLAILAGSEGELALAEADNWLGLVHLFDGKPDSARNLFEQALTLNQEWADPRGIALSTFHLGILESNLGQEAKALELLTQSLGLYQEFGDIFFIARVSLFLGYLYLDQGIFDQAQEYFEDHLELDTHIQFWDGIAEGWRDLGNLYSDQGEEEKARECYAKCRMVCQEHGLTKSVPSIDP